MLTSLKVTKYQGTPVLKIGSNHLEGKVIPLKKQLAVLEKEEAADRDSKVCFNVTGIIKRKIVFKTRPKPITVPRSAKKQKLQK